MDEKRPGARTSALPRPTSRLPLPRSSIPTPSASSATRHQASSSIGSTKPASTTAPAPRLRSSVSREQLNSAPATPTTLRKPTRSAAPPSFWNQHKNALGPSTGENDQTDTSKYIIQPGLKKIASHASLSASTGPSIPSPERNTDIATPKYGSSKTVTSRPLKTRASVNGLSKKPSIASLSKPQSTTADSTGTALRKGSHASIRSTSTIGDKKNRSSASTVSTALTFDSADDSSATTAQKSSSALRDQIAKAKAAKRAMAKQAPATQNPDPSEAPVVPVDAGFDFGFSDDPFGQNTFEASNRKVMQARINTARTTGKLNVAAMGLKEIPAEVLNMYDLESIGGSGGAWAESVDLTRLVVADNELETIDDAIFPDIDPDTYEPEEDDRGRIFWGLESADFHNNTLISLPMGFRRLQLLTSLNLASNKLTNNALEIISQCTNLRDLKLANNLLYGTMDECFQLENLEILDLHGNNITALPSGIDRMKRLRILNLDENGFESLPFKSLSTLPLTELLVRKNKLSGILIEGGVESLPHLQILDCSNNQIAYLSSPDSRQTVNLPSLHQLSVSTNRITALPDMTSWSSILTINADENSIASFPEGFTSCQTLRHAGFTSNDIRVIPPEIARMDNLVMLRITGNPLRDKKFTSLTTEALKDALEARLQPLPGEGSTTSGRLSNSFAPLGSDSADISREEMVEPIGGEVNDDEQSDYDDFATPPTSVTHSPARSRAHTLSNQVWPIKAGGILDRSNTGSSSLHPVVCSKIAAKETVRDIRLQHNTFTQFPNSLSFFTDTLTSLSMSHNQLTGESWLTEPLDLTALRELNLQNNFCTSLTPLTTHLCAPNLEKLDMSFNRVVRLPKLRDTFPSLTVLLISNNHLEELGADLVEGMKIIDASNNEISHLPPHLGLLGLDRLDVMGNRFRVPRWNVLERGTEATLRWLRGRVPVAEMAEWRAKAGSRASEESTEAEEL
ncbi:hypothetical protein F4780DRAFT_781819 [Xylariomycetidae sp. FL0641]|nr:hypothetical protein F4780DRAFT_781819 [Xylariomycetidae sp. FL0641]